MSKTISITIPTQLEKSLQDEAIKQGISRSRFICNILLRWKEKEEKPSYTQDPMFVRLKNFPESDKME